MQLVERCHNSCKNHSRKCSNELKLFKAPKGACSTLYCLYPWSCSILQRFGDVLDAEGPWTGHCPLPQNLGLENHKQQALSISGVTHDQNLSLAFASCCATVQVLLQPCTNRYQSFGSCCNTERPALRAVVGNPPRQQQLSRCWCWQPVVCQGPCLLSCNGSTGALQFGKCSRPLHSGCAWLNWCRLGRLVASGLPPNLGNHCSSHHRSRNRCNLKLSASTHIVTQEPAALRPLQQSMNTQGLQHPDLQQHQGLLLHAAACQVTTAATAICTTALLQLDT